MPGKDESRVQHIVAHPHAYVTGRRLRFPRCDDLVFSLCQIDNLNTRFFRDRLCWRSTQYSPHRARATLPVVQDLRTSRTTPLVSVVIPAYQAAHSIVATLDSVLAQTFPDYEIIVVNDGSPDSQQLETVLEPYRGRISYVSQENQGPGGARNTAIRMARGEYVAFLDADDLWEPDHLRMQLAVLRANPSIDMVYADARIFGDVPEQGRTVMEFCPSEGEVTFESLVRRRCTVHICVSLVRRQMLLDAGLFDPAFRGTEDIDMWLRIAKRGGRITYQRRVLGSYRRQPGSLSADPVRLIEGLIAVLAKAARDPNATPAERELIEQECHFHRARLTLEKGKRAFLAGRNDTAISDLKQANAHYKSAKLTMILLLLRVSPRFLRALYHWRDRHL
jgi:cellulose synthase/poly-beta-1,6-N-acetylglucosamine synthase-like glycosyltransferase